MKKPLRKPKYPNFSSGPTQKPDTWSVKRLNLKFLGRYHRSKNVNEYIEKIIFSLKKILEIPNDYSVFLTPGSCTGAMESILWSLLGKNNITTIVTDHWGHLWSKNIKKLKYKQEIRGKINGEVPDLERIDSNSDLIFVWTGTTSGFSFNEEKWIPYKHKGLIITDITSSVFINEINWNQIDAAAFSWQKALGSESQHGIVVLSPKAKDRLKNNRKMNLPKVLDLNNVSFPINTPSILCLADFEFCLNWYKKKGGLKWSKYKCLENKKILDNWSKNNLYFKYFVKEPNFRANSVSFFILKQTTFEKKIPKIINFLEKNNIAFDISSYRLSPIGIRIWTGPTIKKKDLIALTNWLDWCFYKLI
tara:strand:- start:140 stop:1225 length:1086 start_codon:yes stop_codon:yes gene_type:complete